MKPLLILLAAIVVCSCGGGKDSEWDLTLPKKGATDTGQVLKVKNGQAYWDASGEIIESTNYSTIILDSGVVREDQLPGSRPLPSWVKPPKINQKP